MALLFVPVGALALLSCVPLGGVSLPRCMKASYWTQDGPVTLATRMPFLEAEPSFSSISPRDWLPLRVTGLIQETFLRCWIGGESLVRGKDPKAGSGTKRQVAVGGLGSPGRGLACKALTREAICFSAFE